jgi:hypothetical protein
MTSRKLSLAAAVLFTSTLAAAGRADTVTFGDLNYDPLVTAGAQTESGFTYEVSSGDAWAVTSEQGNPSSALATYYNSGIPTSGDTVVFTRAGGGNFTFVSVDTWTLGGPGESDVVSISGYLGGSLVGSILLDSVPVSPSDPYATVLSTFAGAIDRLEVTVVESFFESPFRINSRILDNFEFGTAAAVPEPSSLALAGVGGLVVAVLARRRHAA